MKKLIRMKINKKRKMVNNKNKSDLYLVISIN
jgi:hypothetical protein